MCSYHKIPLLILHDFDKAGFSIAGTLQRDTRRYAFQNSITTIDLGLSLQDVQAKGLESEHQYLKGNKCALMDNLRKNGATEDDIAFMFADFDTNRSTRRVELNAMTSPQFIAFIERKLTEHGIKKIVPGDDLLGETYKALVASRRLEEIIAEAIKDAEEEEDDDIPDDLADKVAAYLKKNPTVRWDAAIASILKDSE